MRKLGSTQELSLPHSSSFSFSLPLQEGRQKEEIGRESRGRLGSIERHWRERRRGEIEEKEEKEERRKKWMRMTGTKKK